MTAVPVQALCISLPEGHRKISSTWVVIKDAVAARSGTYRILLEQAWSVCEVSTIIKIGAAA